MADLPILQYRDSIIDSLKSGKNLIIKAPTGSGKSTQAPQILLDAGLCPGRILIVQPRRLAARMLAARVASERLSELGAEIGFQTRFETMVTAETRACFITEGILPRMMLSNRDLSGVSAIIFDEFHERNLATDIGLALAVDLQRHRRPDLHCIVMSATIDTKPLAAYVDNVDILECDGRQYPIDNRYMSAPKTTPVWDAAASAVNWLIGAGYSGDILVFMPGAYEIRRTVETINQSVRSESVTVFPLYGDLPAVRQRQVMEPQQRRKIVVATNIAETSLTIPGVRHVIDSGLARVNRFDAGRGLNTLFIEPISLDSADQRAGRAGREAAGVCVRLWSQSQNAGRPRSMAPEVRRVDLTETVLYMRMLGYGAKRLFPWFEAPAEAALTAGEELLTFIGALDHNGALTDLGRELAGFPMHPRLARLLIEAGKHGAVHCATFAAALLSERSALMGKPDFPQEAYNTEAMSDVYGQYCLLEKVRASGFDPALCTRYGVSIAAAQAIFRTQALFLQYCRRYGMHTRDAEGAPEALARCMLAAYPDHLCVRKDQGTLLCSMKNGRTGELARESLARSARCFVAADIREIKTGAGAIKTLLSLAAEVKEAWLQDDFPDHIHRESGLEWNTISQSIEGKRRTLCLGVVVEEKNGPVEDPAQASAALAEIIISKDLHLAGWDQNVDQWIGRLRWLSAMFPEMQLPAVSDEDRRIVVHELCEGEVRYERVREKPVLPVVKELLSAAQRSFVESMAPEVINLPTGRKMRIVYAPGAAARGRARIQDLYGLRSTPRIAQGRAPVSIEVLAPNNRPVQITDDLESFWKVQYPDLKKSLSRRYPKHEWR